MTKFLLFGDAHLETGVEEDPAYNLIKMIVKKEKFEGIVMLGDMLDFSYISRWTEEFPGLQEGKRMKEDFEILESELQFFRKHTKELIYLEGNHELRVMKYIQKNPVLEGILDLKEICRENDVKYISTNKQPYRYLPDLMVTHGLSISKYVAAQIVTSVGESIVCGHTHRSQNYSYRYPNGNVTTGYSIGTVGTLNPDFIAGNRVAGWTSSFGVLYVEGTKWQLDTILIKDGESCILGGKVYSLAPKKGAEQ